MPRTEIELPYRIEFLSILDQEGRVDASLDPGLPNELLLRLYRGMLLARFFDDRMLVLQRQGRIGTFAPTKGQEAQVGAVAPLEPDDWLVPSFREMPAEVWRGKSLQSVLLFYGGYNEGGFLPPGLNNLPVSVPVGTQMLHAVGIGYGMKYRGKKNVVVTFFGDGATSEGDFHEAMNFAGVFRTPVIFICQNNHWAISLPRNKQTRSRTIAQKALAYGVPGIQVDGNDVLAVYAAAKEAVERARAGDGPTLIESITYRLSVHTTADDPKKYRKQEEVDEWLRRDPLVRFRNYLSGRGLLSEEEARGMEDEVKAEIRAAEDEWAGRIEKPLDPLEMFTYAYAELPPYLRMQRDELARELEARRGDTKKESVVRD